MPLLNFDEKTGTLYEAAGWRSDGLGFGRAPYEGDTRDVMLNKPAVWAEQERARKRKSRKAYDAKIRAWNNQRAMFIKKQRAEAARRAEIERRDVEAAKARNGGDHPLLERAAVQTMLGKEYETVGISGYGFSSDGRPDHDRLAASCMGRSADFDYAETIDAEPFSVQDTIPTGDFGGFPSLSEFIAPSISTAAASLAQRVGGILSPAPLPPPLPAQPPGPSPAQVQAQRQADLLSVMEVQSKQREEERRAEEAQMKKYLTYGGIGLGVILAAGIGYKIMARK